MDNLKEKLKQKRFNQGSLYQLSHIKSNTRQKMFKKLPYQVISIIWKTVNREDILQKTSKIGS